MATPKAEIRWGNETQKSRAGLFNVRQDLSSGLAGLGELTIHSGRVFSCEVRNDQGPNLNIEFNGGQCRISTLDDEGNTLQAFSSSADAVRVATTELLLGKNSQPIDTVLVFPLKDSSKLLLVGKTFVLLA